MLTKVPKYQLLVNGKEKVDIYQLLVNGKEKVDIKYVKHLLIIYEQLTMSMKI